MRPFADRKLPAMSAIEISAIRKLSLADRLRLVEEIWDSIAEEADLLPVSDGERDMIDERIAAYRRAPGTAVTWEEAKARILRS